jgi:hypothetical protein
MSQVPSGTRRPGAFRACADSAFRDPAFPLLAALRQPPASATATATGRLGWRQAAPATCASERRPLRPARSRRPHPGPSGDHGSAARPRRGSAGRPRRASSDRSRPEAEPAARPRRGSSDRSSPEAEPAARSRRVREGRRRRGPAVQSRPTCARPRRSRVRPRRSRALAGRARVPACLARAGTTRERRRRSRLRRLVSGDREQPACRDTRRRTACSGGFRPKVGRSYVLRMLAVAHWSRGRDGRLRRMVTTQS